MYDWSLLNRLGKANDYYQAHIRETLNWNKYVSCFNMKGANYFMLLAKLNDKFVCGNQFPIT